MKFKVEFETDKIPKNNLEHELMLIFDNIISNYRIGWRSNIIFDSNLEKIGEWSCK